MRRIAPQAQLVAILALLAALRVGRRGRFHPAQAQVAAVKAAPARWR